MIFLSLGAGVQSSVMLMRAIAGDIERPDHVIFADTGWEPRAVYEHLAWLSKQCAKAGLPLHIVSNGDIRQGNAEYRNTTGGRFATMPFFIRQPDGTIGAGRRQCTSEYKLTPLRRKMRELLGHEPRQRIPPGTATTYIGISTDEARRAAPSRDAWIDNAYPLIDPLKMSRGDCQAWWDAHFPHRQLPKSSCIGCPYKSDAAWRSLPPDEFEDACAFDEQIRRGAGMRGESYLHRSCKPLRDALLNREQDSLDLEDQVYCAGGCGL